MDYNKYRELNILVISCAIVKLLFIINVVTRECSLVSRQNTLLLFWSSRYCVLSLCHTVVQTQQTPTPKNVSGENKACWRKETLKTRSHPSWSSLPIRTSLNVHNRLNKVPFGHRKGFRSTPAAPLSSFWLFTGIVTASSRQWVYLRTFNE